MLSAVFASLTLSCGNNTGIDIDIEVDMGKPNFRYDETDCTGGINGQLDRATKHQCSEAVNVWAPDGTLIQRPGYAGVLNAIRPSQIFTTSQPWCTNDTFVQIIEAARSTTPVFFTTAAGAYSDLRRLDATAVGALADRLYVAIPSGGSYPIEALSSIFLEPEFYDPGTGAQWMISTAASLFKVEYSSADGTWKPLNVRNIDAIIDFDNLTPATSSVYPYFTGGGWLDFIAPNDWGTATVSGTTAYFLRLMLIDADAANTYNRIQTTVRYSTRVPDAEILDNLTLTDRSTLLGAAVVPFANGESVFVMGAFFSTNYKIQAYQYDSIGFNHFQYWSLQASGAAPLYSLKATPVVMAAITPYNEAYVSYDYNTFVLNPLSASTSATLTSATVEDNAALLTPFTAVDLLLSWPEAEFYEYFRGELWAARLKNNGKQVRWSAATSSFTPGYKIWPNLNTEVLIDNDVSDVTGIKGFGQNMVIFKSDSMYEMVDAGISENDLQLYAPERRVTGKGFVSHHSVVEINGQLVGLAEDSIYAYSGRGTMVNLGIAQRDPAAVDRIKHIIKRLNPSRRQNAVGAHWKNKHCYLLALSLDTAANNNAVLVFDYENDSWWLWEGLEVERWLSKDNTEGEQILYFVDRAARVYQLGSSNEDHGAAITSHITTRKLAQGKQTLRARTVEIEASSLSRELELEITANGAPFGAALGQTGTLDYTDAAEKEYDVAVYDVDKYTLSRDRTRDRGVLLTGKSFQVKVTHDEKGIPFELGEIRLGVVPTGKR